MASLEGVHNKILAFEEKSTAGRGTARPCAPTTAGDSRKEEGLKQIQEILSFLDSMETRVQRSAFLAFQAEGHMELKQTEAGLSVITQALDYVGKSGERFYEAELYRLKGELTLQKEFKVPGSKSQVRENQKSKGKGPKAKIATTDPRSLNPDPQGEAEACLLKAIDIAQRQQAKSLELRASTSLARLWQQQGKHHAARNMLAEIYNWFTEGFDTKDLQEAKTLLEELSS
jgi:predicted ATPase